jgi:hypothetical protein
MSFFPNAIHAQHGDEKKTSTDKRWELGKVMVLPDGRAFKYFKLSSVAITAPIAGKLLQTAVHAAAYDQIVPASAAAVGATSVTLTLNASGGITAGDYNDGYLSVNDDAGEGYVYKIASNPTAAAAASAVIELYPNDPIKVALTTVTTCTLLVNECMNAVIFPTAAVGAALGVVTGAVGASEYGWAQFRGPCTVLIEGTALVGKNVMPSATTAGAVLPYTAGGDDEQLIGRVMEVAPITTEYALIDLCM